MSGMTSLVQAAGVIEHKMETVANNLANVNTVGFKEDQPTFREVLSSVQRIVPESLEEDFYHMNTWMIMSEWINLL